MAKRSDPTIEATPHQLEELIERVERGELAPSDRALIVRVIRLVLTLTQMLQHKNATISRLKRMLFGPRTDRRAGSERSGMAGAETSQNATRDASGSGTDPKAGGDAAARAKGKGHGRRSTAQYGAARHVACSHPGLAAGDACPSGCGGRVFTLGQPSLFLQFDGHPLVEAVAFERERMRCSSCQAMFVAPLPDGVGDERFTASADAAIAVSKYGLAVPFHRRAWMQGLEGVPLPASVQWERCERVADAALPVYLMMMAQAARSGLLYGDDTKVRILSLRKPKPAQRATSELEETTIGKGERTGVQTTCVVAGPIVGEAGPRVALFFSGRAHCGENVKKLLAQRPADLGPVIRMTDAEPKNRVGEATTIDASCLAHGRRKFVECQEAFPAECAVVLEAIGRVYGVEADAKGKTAGERLALHQEKSAPVLEELEAWMRAQFAERLVEPSSSLGSAIKYLQGVWEEVTQAVKIAGAPLDNNPAERSLKRSVLLRKNALFFKTEHGAAVGDILVSVIETCALNGVNPLGYLRDLRANRQAARASPEAWLPWSYQARVHAARSPEAA